MNSPLGPCVKEHKEFLKTQFENDRDHEYYKERYEKDLYEYLRGMVLDLDNRIEMNKKIVASGGSDTSRRRKAGLAPMNNEQMVEQRLVTMKKEVADKLKEAEIMNS